MTTFTFEISESWEEIDGYSFGNITIENNPIVFCSKQGGAKHEMMIFYSLVELMDGLRKIMTKSSKRYEFVGVDSSFCILFERYSNLIEISHKGVSIERMSDSDLFSTILLELQKFLDSNIEKLSVDDIIYDDLARSFDDYKSISV